MAYKLKIGPAQGLKLKGSAGFALPMIGGAGIAAAKAGGIWTVSLDYSEIQSGATVSDDTAYFLTWDSASGIYTRINATDLKAEFEGTFDGYYQPLDATLTALAALDSTAGLLAQTGADTFARRTLTGTANEITVTNGAGTAGNPTVSLPNALTFTGKTVTGGTFQSPTITTPTGIVKGDVGLANVDNTSDATKNAASATLTNKTIDTAGPNTIKVNGNTLAASAGTATVTIPNATDTLVGRATTDTLTNKTISGASNTLSNIGNSSLTNSSITIAGHSVALGGTQAIAAADLSNGVTGSGAVVLAASPALTGTPTAPTAAGSDNSTKIATTAYVDAQVAGGVAGVASLNGQTGALQLNIVPQGRLTLTSATVITTTDVTAAASVYYTLANGNQIPIYDGTRFVPTVFSELTLALDSLNTDTGYHQSGKNFDAFVINDAGTVRLGSGPAWNSGAVAGSDTARGTGAGSTEIEIYNGVPVNKNTITIRFGSASGNTVSVAARQATYVGTFRTTADGQTEDSKAKRFLWNAHNQQPRLCRNVTETTDSWPYTTAAFRQANANTANQLNFVIGLPGGLVNATVLASVSNDQSGTSFLAVGIGLDSTTVNSAQTMSPNAGSTQRVANTSKYVGYPGIGYHFLAWLEYSTAVGTTTWYGDSSQATLCQSGIFGELWG